MNKKKILISNSDYSLESNTKRKENVILIKSQQVKDVKFKFQGKIFKFSLSIDASISIYCKKKIMRQPITKQVLKRRCAQQRDISFLKAKLDLSCSAHSATIRLHTMLACDLAQLWFQRCNDGKNAFLLKLNPIKGILRKHV